MAKFCNTLVIKVRTRLTSGEICSNYFCESKLVFRKNKYFLLPSQTLNPFGAIMAGQIKRKNKNDPIAFNSLLGKHCRINCLNKLKNLLILLFLKKKIED